ncbi:MAG: tyrosine recombinase XerC [Clostridiales bacterium]|jgi:site-specific recombinase XerD|nr:tyrosine recombinase XerC [Clostridiales bacterium]
MDYRTEASGLIRDFLSYHEIIKGHSKKTIDEYFLDLRTFFRYLKIRRGLADENTPFDNIPINDIDLDFVATVTKSEVYDYLSFLSRDRVKNRRSKTPEYGLSANSRARKLSAISSLFKYLTVKTGQLKDNPIEAIDTPKTRRSLPRYLTLEESKKLLSSVDGLNRERDICILTIFLNCGIRISELVGLNIGDIRSDHLRILGKGNKERIVYLNEACVETINDYLKIRKKAKVNSPAFFLSTRNQRISRSTVHTLVKKHIAAAGLSPKDYSSHKLRHTAATLMLKNGVDLRTLQELLGHEHINTTEIYTHVDSTDLRIAANANPLSSFKPKND